MSNQTNGADKDPDADAVREAAIAIIERGDAAPSPLPNATQESPEHAERLRRLAVELGRSVDA